jgi:putative polymerase
MTPSRTLAPTTRLRIPVQASGEFHLLRKIRDFSVSRETLAAIIIYTAVLFNFGLAFINANGISISRTHVILAELAIVGSTFAFCFRFWSPLMLPWLWVTWLIGTLFIALSLARGGLDPKHIRDVLLIPIFIMLGIASRRGNIVRLMCGLQAIVLIIMIFEAVAPQAFGRVFNIMSYYINTRDFRQEGFWNADSNLFLSSLRPGERFLFPFLNIHRLSSVFLEPVSLGNWCILVTIFIASFWRSLSFGARTFLVTSNAMVLVGSDGRLATVNCLVVACAPLFSRLPRYIYALYLPGIVLCALTFVLYFGLEKTADDFAGRIAYSMNALASIDLGGLLGVDLTLIGKGADSGILYFILTQSIMGVAALWSALCFFQPPSSRRAVIMMHGICFYLAFNLMVSFSLFSIKTAAPLWFLYGYVRGRTSIEQVGEQQLARSASSRMSKRRDKPEIVVGV